MKIISFTSMEQRSELLLMKMASQLEELSSGIKMESNSFKGSAGLRLQSGLISLMKMLLNIGQLFIVMINSLALINSLATGLI
jgi:hypothetical protein